MHEQHRSRPGSDVDVFKILLIFSSPFLRKLIFQLACDCVFRLHVWCLRSFLESFFGLSLAFLESRVDFYAAVLVFDV